MNLLIIGDPKGTHSMCALKKYSPEDIWVWENDPRHIYTINQIDDKINVVENLNGLDMNFTYGIGNPPYKGQLHLEFLKLCLEKCDNVHVFKRCLHFFCRQCITESVTISVNEGKL